MEFSSCLFFFEQLGWNGHMLGERGGSSMNYVGTFFLWSFFIFGVLEFCKKVFFEINIRRDMQKGHGKVLLIVKNNEKVIESILRTLDYYGVYVVVMDRGSTDCTEEIIERFAKNSDCIEYLEMSRTVVAENDRDCVV